MTGNLDAIRLKVARAEVHLAYFKGITTGHVGPIKSSNAEWVEFEDQGKTTHLEADVATPPPNWSIAIGDVIHQLRTCLDHLVFALATRGGRIVEKPHQLSFPLAKSAIDFRADYKVSQGIFEKVIGADELAAIELAQPYRRKPKNPAMDYLYVLGKLDDIDKHRAIIVLANQLAVKEKLPKGFTYSTDKTRPGKDGFKIGWVTPDQAAPAEPPDRFHMRVSIKEPGVITAENSATRVIQSMIEDLTAVLDQFERFF